MQCNSNSKDRDVTVCERVDGERGKAGQPRAWSRVQVSIEVFDHCGGRCTLDEI